jgi:hypothetical protein
MRDRDALTKENHEVIQVDFDFELTKTLLEFWQLQHPALSQQS